MITSPAIQIAGLTKSYGDHSVLRGVDFDVASGSVLALLGSNGAGKTTVVKVLCTLLRADGGTVVVNGHDVSTQAARVRESVSMTGQFTAVDEVLTGRENLVLVAQLRRVRDPGEVADGLLKRFDLTEAGMSLIGDLSVIFLDEPTTGLDPQSRTEVWKTVKRLAAQGTTVVLTTQHLDQAEQLADQVAILHNGRIIAGGTLAELKELLPPARVEYVEKQPTLEEIFLAIVGRAGPRK
jgi:ABC-2 type transport system ATP-binding protein